MYIIFWFFLLDMFKNIVIMITPEGSYIFIRRHVLIA